MTEETKKYYHVENLKKKDRRAIYFSDWIFASVLTELEGIYLTKYEQMTAMEKIQVDERMDTLINLWDKYRAYRERYITLAIDSGKCVENLTEYEEGPLSEDWHEVLEG